MRTLNFRLAIDGVNDETLVVREFQGNEFISDGMDENGQTVFGYRYQIALASRNSGLSAEQIVDSKALLEVIRNGQVVSQVHGIIRNLTKGDTGFNHTFYTVTLVPSLERLSLRHNSRIFQQQDAQVILTTLLDEMGITDYAFSVRRTLAQREFCVQYRETDAAFFHRLAAEEGLMYFFVHEDTKHTLVITDNPEGFVKPGLSVPYNVVSGGAGEIPYISGMNACRQTEVSAIVHQDYSFKKPDYSFVQQLDGKEMDYQLQTYEHFDYPGRYKDDTNGKAFTQIRLEFLRREANTVTGTSDESRIQSGCRFEVKEHLDEVMNRLWLTVAVTHQGSQPQALEEEGSSGATTYSNQFKLIPGDLVWRARPQPKPQVDGPCMAKVVGPAGEEIYCDEHGRVKLHFPWDRESNMDDKSSCWVRVSQGWAGGQYGMMAIPRIGHEVIVSFLNGDPDQPIVTGRTYHASNTPPYTLPEAKTKTVWRSDSHQGEGFNEFSFEDQANQELVYLHAQKDQKIKVLHDKNQEVDHDETHQIGHDHQLTIGNDRTKNVGNNESSTIKVNQTHQVGQDRQVNVGQDETHYVKRNQVWTVDGKQDVTVSKEQTITVKENQTETFQKNQTVSVTKDQMQIVSGTLTHQTTGAVIHTSDTSITLQCGNSSVEMTPDCITLQTGASSIKLDSTGIYQNGTKIKLN
ncbi:Phage-related baseplate assembly protein [Vibrio aerogenes CECT 7868]|uniref:Phage-related baseplate assembly protein n=1 Tax=Vibrio aerogenes CECT 7868 TaxID=1216006 RepID=A0A1M5Z279_9VIBR|nr:type VI secretion system tip protein TssI/VgrG [Vibrio aerogenes]SHI18340.1 Phage-related baseplate assembly protein [Vibrio aerogenes CECT 7868]